MGGVLTYDSANNIATVDTGNTSYRYLYFSILPGVAFAVYSADDTSLTFYKNADSFTTGQQYKGKTATKVYTGIEDDGYIGDWSSYSSIITSVKVVDKISPKSTAFWFSDFSNPSLTMDLSKLDTSNVQFMISMFANATVTKLDIDSWDVSNVIDMSGMFYNCFNLIVDLSNWEFDTASVVYDGFNYNAPGVTIPSSFNSGCCIIC